MNKTITAPVLLIGFNRPDVIKQSFDYIRKAKPQKLYVAIDGARKLKPNENQLVDEVKHIVKNVDWDCETHYKFNSENLGAEVTVSAAVSWVLENEEYVIVLEDDIIAPMSFLNFAQDMLLKYADQDNVYMISGGQFTPIKMPNNEDYLFSSYGHTGCGWSTWKRAWRKFDLKINDFDSFLKSGYLDKLVQTKTEKRYWISVIKKMARTGIGKSTWDICWSYIRYKNQGFSIIPRINLTSNIGVYGLHSHGITSGHFRPFDDNFFATIHPEIIKTNREYDKYHFENHINRRPNLLQRAIGKTLRIIKQK